MNEKICRLKQEKDVVILAHYYVDGAVQEIADFVGDSYALAERKQNIKISCLPECPLWERARNC